MEEGKSALFLMSNIHQKLPLDSNEHFGQPETYQERGCLTLETNCYSNTSGHSEYSWKFSVGTWKFCYHHSRISWTPAACRADGLHIAHWLKKERGRGSGTSDSQPMLGLANKKFESWWTSVIRLEFEYFNFVLRTFAWCEGNLIVSLFLPVKLLVHMCNMIAHSFTPW